MLSTRFNKLLKHLHIPKSIRHFLHIQNNCSLFDLSFYNQTESKKDNFGIFVDDFKCIPQNGKEIEIEKKGRDFMWFYSTLDIRGVALLCRLILLQADGILLH